IWSGVIAGMELLTDRVRVAVEAEPPTLVDVTAAAGAELDLSPGRQGWVAAQATPGIAYPHSRGAAGGPPVRAPPRPPPPAHPPQPLRRGSVTRPGRRP